MLIGQISDLHVTTGGRLLYNVVDGVPMVRRCIEDVLRLPQRPDVMLLTGDLVDGASRDEYDLLRELLAPLPMPCYLIPGNHDERTVLREAFADHAYLAQWPPFVQYVIEEFPVRLVALDTVIPQQGGGRLCAERLGWLERTLAARPDRPTVVLMHHPPFKTFIGHMDDIGLEGADALARVIGRHRQVERILCGHLHRPIQARFAGTLASTCPSPVHQVALDLARDAASVFVMEPPAYQLHRWSAETGIVSHTAYIGDFPGPYSF